MIEFSCKVAVTGASGYLGGVVCAKLERGGATVYRLSRKAPENESARRTWLPFSLDEDLRGHVLRDHGINCLVHCAYDFSAVDWRQIEKINIEGSLRLLWGAREQGVERIIYISSMSAFDGCRSLYGKAKLAIEHEALRMGAVVVRPGLIHGNAPGGMVGSLIRLVNRLPIVPLIGRGSQLLYLVHEDDLTAMIERLCADQSLKFSAPLIAANENGKSFAQILRMLAAQQRRRRLFLPVPWRLIWAPLRMAEALRLPARFRSDSVISLIHQDPHPELTSAIKTGIRFRDFPIASTTLPAGAWALDAAPDSASPCQTPSNGASNEYCCFQRE